MNAVAICIGFLLLVGCDGSSLEDDTDLRKVENSIVAAWHKHKSIRCQLKQQDVIESGSKIDRHTKTGTMEVVIKQGKVLSRTENSGTYVEEINGKKQDPRHCKDILVFDGDYRYSLNKINHKMNRGQAASICTDRGWGSPDPAEEFATARKSTWLTRRLLPEETLHGHPVYVIEEVETGKDGAVRGKRKSYYRRDGVMVKHERFTAEGRPWTVTEYTDFEFDVEIDPDRFVLNIPDGVEVQKIKAHQGVAISYD